MYQRRGNFAAALRAADGDPQAFCVVERWQQGIDPADFRGVVTVGASGAAEVVLCGEFFRPGVVFLFDHASVACFNCVHQRGKHFEGFQIPTRTMRVKGVGDADERALILQLFQRFQRFQPAGYFPGYKGCQQFAFGGLHFFANDDQVGRGCLGFAGSSQSIVVRNHQAIQTACACG